MLHRERHPDSVPGCPQCRWASVSIAPSATPSRHPQAAEVRDRDRRWEKDMGAYRRLRDDGVQPRAIDGAAKLEAKADAPADITLGLVGVPRSHRSQVDAVASGEVA